MPLPATFADLRGARAVMVYLPRLAERARHSLRKLREAGFSNVELVEGVDGSVCDPRAVGRQRDLHFDVNLTAGEIGCSLSMIAVWQRVIDEALPFLLVFEDDVLPHPEVARIGPAYWAETPLDADFVFLGNQMMGRELHKERRVVTAPSWCLHAYVVTNEGARRGLSLVRRQLDREDRWLSAVDIELRSWMERGDIRHACWNGTMLPPPYPVSSWPSAPGQGPDVIRAKRDTGLFFQNCALGSATRPHEHSAGRHRRSRPEILFISPAAPHREGNGMAMRAGVTLEGLAQMGDVTLVLAPHGFGDVSGWAAEKVQRTLVLSDSLADPFLRHLGWMAPSERGRARLAYPRPLAAAASTPAAAAAIAEFVSGRVDLVYVMRSYLAPLAEPWLTDGHRLPLIVDVDEDDARFMRQLAALYREENDVVGAAVAMADADKLDRIAEQWIARADIVLAASDIEVTALRHRFGDVSALVLPNPVPQRGRAGSAERVDVAFVANFDYAPNQDAARWFCRQVLPHLRHRLGREVRVALAGSNMGPGIEELQGGGVLLVANPESVTPLYEATTIAVAPLRACGGTRLKILEAFGHRRMVVSTSRGAEGLPVEAGRHLLIADEADDFAEACARALTDERLRARVVAAAVEVAMAHAWPRVAGMVAEIAEGVLGAGARRRAGAEPAATAAR